MILRRTVACTVMGVLIAGCATDAGQKEQAGTVLGAIIGGVLGGAVTRDRNRATGVVVGALAGGLVGQQVGRYFDEQDRRKIAEAAQRALQEGSTQTYVSPKSGAAVTMTPSQSTLEPGRSVRALSSVYIATAVRAESRQAFGAADTATRSIPSPTAETSDRLSRAEPIEVVGIVPNSPYRLVAREGVAIGYVLESELVDNLANLPPLVQASRTASPAVAPSKPVAKAVRKPTPKTPAEKPALSEVAAAPPPPKAPDVTMVKPSAASPAEVKTASLAKECKVLTYQFVLPDGQRSSGTQKSCYEPPAGWQAAA